MDNFSTGRSDSNMEVVLKPEFGPCPWCKGRGRHGSIGQYKCEHCDGERLMRLAPIPETKMEQVLPKEVVAFFAEYWCDFRRNQNLGEFIEQVAKATKEHIVGNTVVVKPGPTKAETLEKLPRLIVYNDEYRT